MRAQHIGELVAAIGIDLGTAFARAAVVRGSTPQLVQFHDGARNLPAVVHMGRDAVRVGSVALARATTDPSRTVRAVKRLLGRSVDDPVIKALATRAPFGFDGSPGQQLKLRLGDDTYEVEQVAAALLRHILQVAEQQQGEAPTSAVLAIPYWYGPRQRKALQDSARRAGLTSLQLLSEATCTALSLLDADIADRMVAIVDVGAGGCTASVIELGPARVRLVATSGDPLGGGEDVDWAMARAVFKGLKSRFGEFDAHPAIVEMLRQTCESAKQGLAQMATVTAIIPFLPIGAGVLNQQVQMDRATAEMLTRDTAVRVGAACSSALEGARLSKGELAAVYATGGSAKLLAVRAAIEQAMGAIASRRLDPDGSVALGAAWHAAMLEGAVESIPVLDVQTTMSLPPAAGAGAPSLPPASVQTVRPASAAQGPVEKLNVEAFRLELAGLLASLRAGAVTDAGTRKKAATSVRASELVDEPAGLDAPTIERNAARLQEIWTLLAHVMQTARQYRWDHPQTERQLEHAASELNAALALAPSSLAWDVGSMQFTYHDHTVWKPDRAPYDRIPYELFAEGVRRLQLLPGIHQAELRDFLGVLLRDAALGFGSDDDAATALWDRKLSHVAWLAVDAFSEGDDPIFQQHRDEIARQVQQLASLGDEGNEAIEAYTLARREAAERAATVALDEATKAELVQSVDPGYDQWLDRFGSAFVLAWQQGRLQASGKSRLGPLNEWTDRQVTAHAPGSALELLCGLDLAADDVGAPASSAAFRTELSTAMFPPARVATVFEDLRDDSEPRKELVHGVRRMFALAPAALLLEQAIAIYPVLQGPLQECALEYIGLHAAGHEPEVAGVLSTCEPAHALRLVHRLRELGTPEASAAVSAALRSPHVQVRMEGLAALPEAPAERVRDDVRRLIEDEDASMRLDVLRTIAAARVLAAGPALTRRVQDELFLSLPAEERKLLFDAVGALNRRRADELAITWLNRQQVFSSDALDQTRVLAADFLSGSESTEALEALQRASKRRLFASQSVREAAQRAAESVSERRSSAPAARRGA